MTSCDFILPLRNITTFRFLTGLFLFGLFFGTWSLSFSQKTRDSLHIEILKVQTVHPAEKVTDIHQLEVTISAEIINYKKGLGALDLCAAFFSDDGVMASPVYDIDSYIFLKKSSTWEKTKREGFKVHRKLFNLQVDLKPSEINLTNNPKNVFLKLFPNKAYDHRDTSLSIARKKINLSLPRKPDFFSNESFFRKTPYVKMNKWSTGINAKYGFDVGAEIAWQNPHPYYAALENGRDPYIIELDVEIWDTSGTTNLGKKTYLSRNRLEHGHSTAEISCRAHYKDFNLSSTQPILLHIEAHPSGGSLPIFSYTTIQQYIHPSELDIIPLKHLRIIESTISLRDTVFAGNEPAIILDGSLAFSNSFDQVSDPISQKGLPVVIHIASKEGPQQIGEIIHIPVSTQAQKFSFLLSKVAIFQNLQLDSGYHDLEFFASALWEENSKYSYERRSIHNSESEVIHFFMPAVYRYGIRATNVQFSKSDYDVKGISLGGSSGKGYPDPYMALSNSAGDKDRTLHSKNKMFISSASGSLLSASHTPSITISFMDRDRGMFNFDDVIGRHTFVPKVGYEQYGLSFGNVGSCDLTVTSKNCQNRSR